MSKTFTDFRKIMLKKAKKNGIPMEVLFELTPRCNLDCKMCYVHLSNEQITKPLLTVEQWKTIIDEAFDAGMMVATLTGGEFFTYIGWEEIYKHLFSKGINVCLKTNGVLLNRDRINLLKRFPPYSINVSVYGGSEEAYEKVTGVRAFSIVKNNIDLAKNENLPINIALTVSRSLLPYLDETLDYIKSTKLNCGMNVSLHQANENTGRKLEEYGLSTEEAIYCIRQKRKYIPSNMEKFSIDSTNNDYFCGAGRNYCAISWNGIMKMCARARGADFDVLKDGFITSWKNLNQRVQQFHVPKECEKCSLLKLGGCKCCPVEHQCSMDEEFIIDQRICERKMILFEEWRKM